jgi:hypothetical protein
LNQEQIVNWLNRKTKFQIYFTSILKNRPYHLDDCE